MHSNFYPPWIPGLGQSFVYHAFYKLGFGRSTLPSDYCCLLSILKMKASINTAIEGKRKPTELLLGAM